MVIHKQGYKIIILSSLFLIALNYAVLHFFPEKKTLNISINIISILYFILLIIFFRNPKRVVIPNDNFVFSPADGVVVVKEKVFEKEFFNDERIQISIFMNIYNVHKNWAPVTGVVEYIKYHKGKYLIASLPKSSESNERNTVAIKNNLGYSVLTRQIAGFVARRIVSNFIVNQKVTQNDELGFIKFGSRLDVFLPLNAIVHVKIGDKVSGGLTVIADLYKEKV
jgi:phosphatidylserine decarboxylase